MPERTSFQFRIFAALLLAACAGALLMFFLGFGTRGYSTGKMLAALLLGLLIAGGLAVWLSRLLNNTLKSMIQVVESVASGTMHRRLHTLPGPEFESLRNAVNNMADRIEANQRLVNEQETQLETILESMQEGVLVVDGRGRIQRANRSLAVLFPELSWARGRLPVEAIPFPEMQEALNNLLAMPHGKPGNVALLLKPHDDCTVSVQIVRPSLTTARVGAVLAFHDLSAGMRLENIRRDFVANVSHELRTPLTAVQGYTETLLEMEQLRDHAALDPQERKEHEARLRFIDIIRKHSLHMSHIVDDLLTLARLEKHSPMDEKDFRLEDALKEAMLACQPLAVERDLRFEVQNPMPEAIQFHFLVSGDMHRMTQVFRNLLENACKYAEADSVIAILMSYPVTEQTEPRVLVSVCNTGPLIPLSEQSRIFERFYRVEKHRSDSAKLAGKSTGLGLSICKHIIERHHGRIWVESPAPEGWSTAFRFSLPIHKAAQNSNAQ